MTADHTGRIYRTIRATNPGTVYRAARVLGPIGRRRLAVAAYMLIVVAELLVCVWIAGDGGAQFAALFGQQ